MTFSVTFGFSNVTNQLKPTQKRKAWPGPQSLRRRQSDESIKQLTAAAWMLERRYPEEYGKHQRVQLETLTPPKVVEE